MAGSKQRERDLFTALGHPLRRRILRAMIGRSEASPLQLAGRLRVDLTAVSYHMRMLVECGAVELVRVEPGRTGSRQHFYRPIIARKWALSALKAEEPPNPRRRAPRR